jgi:adenine-specific DNA methylase
MVHTDDQRLIEHGFPCHQVGAETQREQSVGLQPPVNRLHVWWARRPLTPSRAAIVASLDSADTDPEIFVRQLGIERVQALVQDASWTLTGELIARVETDASGAKVLLVDERVLRRLQEEDERRAVNRPLIAILKAKDVVLAGDPVLIRWGIESQPLPQPWPKVGEYLPVLRVMGDPAWFKDLMNLASKYRVRVPNLYGYERAFTNLPTYRPTGLTVLDPTSGGGSIPFEALRLGHTVIANELNPVATTILYATLDYPARFGSELVYEIDHWGQRLLSVLEKTLTAFFPRVGPLPEGERKLLRMHIQVCPELLSEFDKEEVTTYLYARQVTCPHCGGEAPLLNTCWLSKEAGDQWGVRIVMDGKQRGGTVKFETYHVVGGRGPNGEEPEQATVNRGTGQCVHCRQAISSEEIKAQARGESPHGRWTDRLYCVVAVRLEPQLDRNTTWKVMSQISDTLKNSCFEIKGLRKQH